MKRGVRDRPAGRTRTAGFSRVRGLPANRRGAPSPGQAGNRVRTAGLSRTPRFIAFRYSWHIAWRSCEISQKSGLFTASSLFSEGKQAAHYGITPADHSKN